MSGLRSGRCKDAGPAPAYDADGVRVRTRAELKAALDNAVHTRGRFQRIEVMISRGVLSDTLSRFVAEVRRSRGQG